MTMNSPYDAFQLRRIVARHAEVDHGAEIVRSDDELRRKLRPRLDGAQIEADVADNEIRLECGEMHRRSAIDGNRLLCLPRLEVGVSLP